MEAVAEMAENRDSGRGPPNITSSGSLEIVGLSTLIQERLQLTLVFTHGQLCWPCPHKLSSYWSGSLPLWIIVLCQFPIPFPVKLND